MKRKQIFNNKEVGLLLERYVRHPHSRKLRAELAERIIPLVQAAITRNRLFHLKDDLQQECMMKILKGLHKYRPERGSAFAFLWSTICNSLKTHGKKLSKGGLSLEEEDIQREAEVAAPIIFQSPEYQYLQKIIAKAVDKALSSPELRAFNRVQDRKALAYIRQSVLNGDLFSKNMEVRKTLKGLGIKQKNIKFLTDYVIVVVRAQLYPQKELLYDLANRKTVSSVPEVVDQ